MAYSCSRSKSARPRALLAASLAVVLSALISSQGRGGPSSTASQSDPVFSALLLDGRMVSGRLISLGPGVITLASAEGAKHELPLDDVFKLTREIPAWVAPLDRSVVVLPEGDCLKSVVVSSATETALQVQSDALGKLAVPLESLVGWIMAVPAQADELDGLWERVRLEPRKAEVVWLANGDRISGGFLGWDDRKIKMQVDAKPVEIDRTGIVAVGFDPTLASYPRPKSGFLELTLKDGTRMGVSGARIDEGNVLATARFGQSVRFLLSELVSVHVKSPRVVYLTEREPIQKKYVPYVGPTREFRADRTIDGHLFQLSGQAFDHGIGTQSRTLLAYPLEPGDRRFQALVGVDERAGPLGSVVFRVLIDNQERFKTPPMTDRDAPRSIDLDLAGGKFLILDTDFGDRGNVRDLADWVEARLIR